MTTTRRPEDAEAAEYRRREREWQNDVGHTLHDALFRDAGAAMVYDRQFARIGEVLGGLPPGPILDIGCGNGQLLAWLRTQPAGRDRLRIGVDVSRTVEVLRGVGAEGLCADGEFLPLREGVAAAVIYNGALHHIVDYRAAVREALRVLRPGGVLVLFEPVSSAFSRLVHHVLDPIVFRVSCEYESPIDQRYKDDFREEAILDELRAQGVEASYQRSDFLAYPVTGCYAGSWFSRRPRVMRALLGVEAMAERLPGLRRVASMLAWRARIVGRKPAARG